MMAATTRVCSAARKGAADQRRTRGAERGRVGVGWVVGEKLCLATAARRETHTQPRACLRDRRRATTPAKRPPASRKRNRSLLFYGMRAAPLRAAAAAAAASADRSTHREGGVVRGVEGYVVVCLNKHAPSRSAHSDRYAQQELSRIIALAQIRERHAHPTHQRLVEDVRQRAVEAIQQTPPRPRQARLVGYALAVALCVASNGGHGPGAASRTARRKRKAHGGR